MGKIAQRISSRQSWAGKWADRVSRLMRQERRTRDLAADEARDNGDSLAGLLQEPIEELLSCADRREFNRALDLLYSALSTQNLANEADAFSLLLEDCAGSVYWERGEGETLRLGESQLFAVGLVAARHDDSPEPVLDEAACEQLRKALVDTQQVSGQGRIVLLPLLLQDAHELELDAWQERRLAQGLQDWAAGHAEEAQPDAAQAQRILASAGHDEPLLSGARGDKGLVELRSYLALGLIIPPGQALEGTPEPNEHPDDAPIGEYFPRREMASILHDLLDFEEELKIVLDLRRGITPADLDPEDVEELRALYEEDRLVDLEADLEDTHREIEELRLRHPQLVKAVEGENYIDAYERRLATALAPVMGDEAAPSLGVRHATEAGPLQEAIAQTFEGHRLITFEIDVLLAARAAGRSDCKGWLADVIVDEDAAALDVQLFDGSRLVHETQWPVHPLEAGDWAAEQLLEALDLLGIRLVQEAGQDEPQRGSEGAPALEETDAVPEPEEAEEVREEQPRSEPKSRRTRRGRSSH